MTAREYILALPESADPNSLEGKKALFHFDIAGEGGGQFSVQVENGQVSVEEGFIGTPDCTVTSPDTVLEGVIKGTQNPAMALFGGKLKVSSLPLLMQYAKLFRIG